jgi:hypothetical protein
MWTPLEVALAPFKELARINRHAIRDARGHDHPLVLRADRCRVHPASAGTSTDSATIELGFSLGSDAYAVHFVGANYRRGGGWDYSKITKDISMGLQSGGLQPGATFNLRDLSRPKDEGGHQIPGTA